MVALAFLFVVIIGLLWIVFRLLQNYFRTYNSLRESHFADDWKNELLKQKTVVSRQENYKEIRTVISKRLMEMEQKFPSSQTIDETSDMFTYEFKKLLYSSLNLLKEKE